MKGSLYIIALCLLISCANKTGECTTTCFSKSTGQNLGSYSYDNYTKSECETLLQNRQTNLTDCSYEWN